MDIWNVHFPVPSEGRDGGGGARAPHGGRGAGGPPPLSRQQQMGRVGQLAQERMDEGLAAAALVCGDFNAKGLAEEDMAPFVRRRG